MQNAIVARGKQITATMRQSFRRLKHLRTSTSSATPVKSSEETTNEQASLPPESPVTTEQGTTAEATSNQDAESTAQEATEQTTDKPDPTEPVIDAPVETHPEPTYLYPNEIGCSVRSFLFADTYLLSPIPATAQKPATFPPRTPSLWSDLKPCGAHQPHRKSLTGFGVQAFARGTADQPRTEWNVVVTRHDGKAFVLSLPNLRRLFKVAPFVDPCAQPLPCVASLSYANFVFWCTSCQLLVTELAPIPRLSSPAFLIAGAPNTLAAHISLPCWARPHQPAVESEEKTDEVTAAVKNVDALGAMVVEPQPCTDGTVNGSTEVHAAEAMETAGPLTERCYSSVVPHAGDVTMDSIKEYLNGEGTVTIKTIETSSEKRTLVEGGHVVTTLHETERVDGKLIKDDILKFSSDDPSLSPAITG
ncbi:uncharacterized protein DEA37_0012783 [Paragonimus westermani]|nr:uncharacterized protein DEA37_0012783 [Paragonimus westermani]